MHPPLLHSSTSTSDPAQLLKAAAYVAQLLPLLPSGNALLSTPAFLQPVLLLIKATPSRHLSCTTLFHPCIVGCRDAAAMSTVSFTVSGLHDISVCWQPLMTFRVGVVDEFGN